jgi:hypothetical protein
MKKIELELHEDEENELLGESQLEILEELDLLLKDM